MHPCKSEPEYLPENDGQTLNVRRNIYQLTTTMKKLFSKIETKIDNTSSREVNNFVGKVFTVGRHTVTVEDVLAEGEMLILEKGLELEFKNCFC